MRHLSLEDLTESARELDAPSLATRERIYERALIGIAVAPEFPAETFAETAPPGPTLEAAAKGAAVDRGLLLGSGKGALIQAAKVAGVALLGGAVFLVIQKPRSAPEVLPTEAPRAINMPPTTSTRAAQSPPQVLPEPPRESADSEAVETKVSPSSSAGTDRDTLILELSLLREARRAVEGGQAVQALQMLDRYAARYPHGKLRSEALATRVLALCELGDESKAKAVARHLKAGSPLGERMKTGCKAR